MPRSPREPADETRFRERLPRPSFMMLTVALVSRYATSALGEGKAETFAMRMAAPTEFVALLANDEILRAKSRTVEAQLRKLSPALDDRFFGALATR